MEKDYINPFDDDRHQFLVLANRKNLQSLWPQFADIPQGWQKIFGPENRDSCLEFIEQQARK